MTKLELVSSGSNNHYALYDLISGSSIQNQSGDGAFFLTDLPSPPSVPSLPSFTGHSCIVQRRFCDPTWHFLVIGSGVASKAGDEERAICDKTEYATVHGRRLSRVPQHATLTRRKPPALLPRRYVAVPPRIIPPAIRRLRPRRCAPLADTVA